jgi:hypothetical protein
MRALLLAGLAALGLAGAAHAEIFKCHGPNGDVRFTSDSSQCPNAVKHEPDAQAVQRAEPAEAPLVSARPGALAKPKRSPAKAAETASGSESQWRQKKRAAQTRQRELEAHVTYLKRVVNWCNRGNSLWKEDDATGLREDVSCKDVDAKYSELREEKAEVERYLAEGLEEECRRAGCLPGWVR